MLQVPRGELISRRQQSTALNPSKRSSKRRTSIQTKESIGFSNKDSQESGGRRDQGVMGEKWVEGKEVGIMNICNSFSKLDGGGEESRGMDWNTTGPDRRMWA